MTDPLSSSASAHRELCPSWCLNDECAESGDEFHVSRTTSVPLRAGGLALVELHQDYRASHALVYVVVEGQEQQAAERKLTPAEARSIAAHLLHHADVAEGLGR